MSSNEKAAPPADTAVQQPPAAAPESHHGSDRNSSFSAQNEEKVPIDNEKQDVEAQPKTEANKVEESPSKEQVPLAQRRGLLARLTLVPELVDPHGYSDGTKWLQTIIIALTAATSSTGSAIFYREFCGKVAFKCSD